MKIVNQFSVFIEQAGMLETLVLYSLAISAFIFFSQVFNSWILSNQVRSQSESQSLTQCKIINKYAVKASQKLPICCLSVNCSWTSAPLNIIEPTCCPAIPGQRHGNKRDIRNIWVSCWMIRSMCSCWLCFTSVCENRWENHLTKRLIHMWVLPVAD